MNKIILICLLLFAFNVNAKKSNINSKCLQATDSIKSGLEHDYLEIMIAKYDNDINRINFIASIALTILGIYSVLNIITGHSKIQDAKSKLKQITDELNTIKIEKQSIKDELKLYINGLISHEMTHHRVKMARMELEDLLEKEDVTKKELFPILSDTLSNPSIEDLLLYNKCLIKTKDDSDILRLVKRGQEIIASKNRK